MASKFIELIKENWAKVIGWIAEDYSADDILDQVAHDRDIREVAKEVQAWLDANKPEEYTHANLLADIEARREDDAVYMQSR